MRTKAIFTILFLLACIQPANGYIVTIQIEAEVYSVDDNGPGDGWLEGQISPGDIITGYYVYESTTLDSKPEDPTQGIYLYDSSPCGLFLSVGGFDFQTDLTNVGFSLAVANDFFPSGSDAYVVDSWNNAMLSNGVPVDHIYWQLDDSTGNALTSDALPTTAPILEDWDDNSLYIAGPREVDFVIVGTVTSATVIPEPVTILLLGFGYLLLRKRS